MPKNNFNMVRLLAAAAVLWSHCYPIALGDGHHDLFNQLLGFPLGRVAVDVFFVASGYLIAGSIFRTRSIVQFAINRGLRIYPGLWACLALTCCVYLITASQNIGWTQAGSEVLNYFFTNAPLVSANIDFSLSGWFENNVLKDTVNGSLWTLPWEIRMYFLLAVSAVLLPRIKELAIPTLCLSFALIEYYMVTQKSSGAAPSLMEVVSRFVYFFFAGSSIQVFAKVWRPSAYLGVVLLVVGAVIVTATGELPYLYYMASVPFAVIGLGLSWVDAKPFRAVANTDVSYGLYLYAFPIQQAVVAFLPGIQPFQLFLAATPLALVCAYLSYRLVEHPALRYKDALFGVWLKLQRL